MTISMERVKNEIRTILDTAKDQKKVTSKSATKLYNLMRKIKNTPLRGSQECKTNAIHDLYNLNEILTQQKSKLVNEKSKGIHALLNKINTAEVENSNTINNSIYNAGESSYMQMNNELYASQEHLYESMNDDVNGSQEHLYESIYHDVNGDNQKYSKPLPINRKDNIEKHIDESTEITNDIIFISSSSGRLSPTSNNFFASSNKEHFIQIIKNNKIHIVKVK
ncbi:hypothetical protein QVN42_05970 [Yersinia nurmii]|uniref:Uncharacterized protein n=1 Tax=Yersinia nurmii TaxID=685706 RepID=A0AAW7JVE0_9GAMM|nr:hypothetical protein [Yersinia nurmii]MDN0086948.1 hypothetical protein [Yersinia nurmii]